MSGVYRHDCGCSEGSFEYCVRSWMSSVDLGQWARSVGGWYDRWSVARVNPQVDRLIHEKTGVVLLGVAVGSAFLGLFSSPPSRSPALGPLLPLLPHDAALRSLCLFTLPRHPSPRPTATSLGPPGVRLTPPHSTLFLLLILILSLDFLSLPSSPALPLKTTIVRQDVVHLNQVLQSVLVYPPTGL